MDSSIATGDSRELDLNFDTVDGENDENGDGAKPSQRDSHSGDGGDGAGAAAQLTAVSATITEAQFRTLERQYQETLAELEAVSSLNRYREEFEKLFGSFRTSFTNEQVLVAVAAAGQARLDSTREKLATAHKRIDDQELVISNYKRELQKALEEVHLAKSEKKEAEEKINALNGEIRRLTTAVDEATDRGNSAESQVEDLKADLANINFYAQDLVKQLAEVNQSNDALNEDLESTSQRVKELKDEIDQYQSKLELQENCLAEELRSKESVMRQLEIAQKKFQFRDEEYISLQGILEDKTIELNFIQANTAKMKSTNEALNKEIEELRKRLEASLEENSSNETQVKKLQAELETWRNKEAQNVTELERIRKELREVTKLSQELKRGEYKAKQNLDKVTNQKTKLLTEMRDLEARFLREKTMKEESIRERDAVIQERDCLSNAKNHAEAQIQAYMEDKKARDSAYETLVADFKKLRKTISDLDAEKSALDSKRAGLQRENENLKARLSLIEHQTASQGAAAASWQRQLKSAELDAKAQLREIDRLRKEKLECSKVAADNMETCEDLKQKVKLLDHRIQLLSENLAMQEDDLSLAQKTILNTKALLERKTEESLTLRKNESTLKKSFSKALSTQKQLEQELTKMGIQSKHHAKLLELVQRERDTLMGHLTQRNDQLMTVMQERQIQEKVLIRSEKDYAEKMMEIQSLKRSLEKLSQENANTKAWAQRVKQESQGLLKERKDLVQQSNKVKQLERELSTPLNVHRWRQLGGTDPEKGELLAQVSKLRRKVISMDKLLHEKTVETSELKHSLLQATQRAEQADLYIGKLGELTDVLNKKTNQIKTLAAEASLNEWKAMDYQKEVESLQQQVRSLRIWKKKHFGTHPHGGTAVGGGAVAAHSSGLKIGPSRVSSSSSSRKRKVAFSQTNTTTKSSTESAPTLLQDSEPQTRSVTEQKPVEK